MAGSNKQNRSDHTNVYIVVGNTVQVAQEEQISRPSDRSEKQAALQRRYQKKSTWDMTYVICITGVILITVLCFAYDINLQSQSIQYRSSLMEKTSTLNDLKQYNDNYEESVKALIDLDQIKETAIQEYGMVYPSEDQIRTYQTQGEDYVRQYGEVPEE